VRGRREKGKNEGREGGRTRSDLPVCQGSQSSGFKHVEAREGSVLKSFQEGGPRVEGGRKTGETV